MQEGEIIIQEGKQFLRIGDGKLAEILRFEDGVPVIKCEVTNKNEGFDKEG